MSLSAVSTAQVTEIAAEVFESMVDGQPGLLTAWPGGPASVVSPLHAWVDLDTEPAGRVHLTIEAAVADDLARALLELEATEPVAEADVVDAFGEIANICSGNIKGLLPEHVELRLPEVSPQSPSGVGAVRLLEVMLAWRGHPLVITVWTV